MSGDKVCEGLVKMLRSVPVEQLMYPPAPVLTRLPDDFSPPEHSPYQCFCIPAFIKAFM